MKTILAFLSLTKDMAVQATKDYFAPTRYLVDVFMILWYLLSGMWLMFSQIPISLIMSSEKYSKLQEAKYFDEIEELTKQENMGV